MIELLFISKRSVQLYCKEQIGRAKRRGKGDHEEAIAEARAWTAVAMMVEMESRQ